MSKSVFQTEEKDKVLIIKAPASLSNDDIDCINVDIKKKLIKNPPLEAEHQKQNFPLSIYVFLIK